MKFHRPSFKGNIRRQLTGLLIVIVLLAALPFAAAADDGNNTIFLPFVAGVGSPVIRVEDNVQNNIGVSGINIVTAGGSTLITYRMIGNSAPSDDIGGCNVDGSNPATLNITAPSGVTATPSSVQFTACGDSGAKSVTFSSNTAGSYPITHVISGGKSGALYNNQANWTLTVNPATPTDTTPPSISYILDPASPDGDNGWYKSDVSLTWTVTENESPTSLVKTGCVDQNITADQVETTYSCSATSDGGSAGPVEVKIKRDGTAPTISGSASPAANGNGWNNTDVDVTFDCDDNLSGVASCGPDQTLSSDGADQSANGTAVDNAGNSASTTVDDIDIDKTDPSVSVTGVTNGATYTLGSVPTAGCSTTDALSGVATHATLSTSGGPVGSITATCSGAVDNADNAANSVSATYTVHYNWTGFFQPVDNLGVLNKAKAGSAIPVKFSLSGDQGLLIFATGHPRSQKINCDATTPTDTIETLTAGSSGLSYDALADQYVYVWKTDKAWAGTCRQLVVKLIDGTEHTANFQFTK